MPETIVALPVRIERINAVMLRGDVHDLTPPLSGNVHTGDIERGRVSQPVQ